MDASEANRSEGLNVVMFSGGAGSWAAAKRVAEKHGTEGLVLLFADTLMEDEDLYRFLDEAAANVGGKLIRLCEGRTPFQVYKDERFLGNHRIDPCSRILKRQLLDKWRDANCIPERDTIYVGYDLMEIHRLHKLQKYTAPWNYDAPLCSPPHITKTAVLKWMEEEGIRPPRLYEMGFPHNNCGGGCCKAGISHFLLLLKRLPERYKEWEDMEQDMRAYLGGDIAMLADRSGLQEGEKRRPLTLKDLRERHEGGDTQLELFGEDWGGCGCAFGGEEDEQ